MSCPIFINKLFAFLLNEFLVLWGSFSIWYLLFCRVVARDRIAMCQSLCPRHCPLPPLLPGCSWTCKNCRPPLPGRASLGYSPHFSARTAESGDVSDLYEPDLPAFTSPPPVLSWGCMGLLSPTAQLTCCLLFLRSLLPFRILHYKSCPRRILRKKERPWTSWHMTDFIWLDFQSQKN